MAAPPNDAIGRVPFIRRIGHDFQRKDGTTVTPTALIHPCFRADCEAYAPHIVGASLLNGQPGHAACSEHLNELLTLVAQHARIDQEAGDASNGSGDLFGG